MHPRLSLLIALFICCSTFAYPVNAKPVHAANKATAALTLYVRIVDAANSQQIQNVNLQLRNSASGRTVQYKTGLEQSPQFSIEQKGQYEVTCSADGFETTTTKVEVKGNKTNIIVRLKARAATAEVSFVAISVTDRFTGRNLIPDVSLNGRRFTSFDDLKSNNGKDNVLAIAVDGYPTEYHTVTPAEIQSQQISVVIEAKAYPFRFTVLSADDKQPINGAEMSWTSRGSQTALSQSIQGKTQLRLERDGFWDMVVKADGFETYQAKFESEKWVQARQFDHEILLTRSNATASVQPPGAAVFDLKKGQRMTLQHIFFDQSSPVLRPESSGELDKLAEALTASPELKIEIRGHTDNTGNFDANVKLSRERCESVVKYLTEKGVSKDRLQFVGKGPVEPVAPNTTEENKKKNRRVEFIVR